MHVAMQVDVVEAQSAAMFERLAKARDFGDAELAHAAFLAAVLQQTLLTSPRVAKALQTIYILNTRLCSLVQVCSLPPSEGPLHRHGKPRNMVNCLSELATGICRRHPSEASGQDMIAFTTRVLPHASCANA